MAVTQARLKKIVEERKRNAYKACENNIKEFLSDRKETGGKRKMRKYKVSVYAYDTNMTWICVYLAHTAEELWEDVGSTLGSHEELLSVEEVK